MSKNLKKCSNIKHFSDLCFEIPSLLIFNTDIFLVTFVWIKEKANAKGNGDWHLRNSRFGKKDMRGFLSFTI